jgi:hypothetical protein
MESLFKCCTEPCDLTRREIQYYYRFRENMVMLYDEDKPEHEELLKQFYLLVFPNNGPLPDKIKSEEWKTIGF